MAINQFFNRLFKKNFSFKRENVEFSSHNWNYIFYLFLLILFFVISIIIFNLINQKNLKERESLDAVIKTQDFSNLSEFFISKLNSPYKEVEYLIQNNDSVEKILKKFNIQSNDIKIISAKLKEKKLTNIFPNKKLSLVLKNQFNDKNTLVNLVYPLSNTKNIQINKSDDRFIITENILKLYKKEVVIKNKIKSNLYSAAVDAGIEPNIIIEFARIFGFEVDFQRDIRKNDWFEIFYERFEDDNDVVQNTGKIIYASMYVNGNEINLYNYNDKNEIGYYDINGKVLKNL